MYMRCIANTLLQVKMAIKIFPSGDDYRNIFSEVVIQSVFTADFEKALSNFQHGFKLLSLFTCSGILHTKICKNVFVLNTFCICLKYKMYLCKLQNPFVQIWFQTLISLHIFRHSADKAASRSF